MFRKIMRGIITIIGGAVGFGLYRFFGRTLTNAGADFDKLMTPTQDLVAGLLIAIIFATIFFRFMPIIQRQSEKISDNIEHDLKEVSLNDILAGTFGLIIGLVIALLISRIFETIVDKYVLVTINVICYIFFGYLGVVIASKKGKDIIGQILVGRRTESEKDELHKKQGMPKILDTSVIIDGRIAEIMKTGFIEGQIVIPEFVLVELRHIADSSDSLKRVRGRRGLDILNRIQEEYGIEIYNTDKEKTLNEIPEVDVKLLKLAQIMDGKVVTNDFNLNKVAGINGVDVLNINELANTLKPVVIPGEEMTVNLVKQGKDASQAVAYLDDGTMIVVEDGRKFIGKKIDITVTSVLQTSAGRMIFGRVKRKKD